MSIIPCGKRKYMQAQMKDTSFQSDSFSDIKPKETPSNSSSDILFEDNIAEKDDSSVRGYVSDFYEKVLGFPPRAVLKHKEKIIARDIDASGNSNLTVRIPNEYYGTGEEFGKDDILRFAEQMKKKFNLFFLQAKDDGKTWTLEFNSMQPESQNQEEIEEVDPLAEFFGGDGAKNKKASFTINELIKENNNNFMSKCIDILSKKE